MSSLTVQHFAYDDRIHVVKERGRPGLWWAVGRHGSYGGAETKARCVEIADAAAATLRTTILVHESCGDAEVSR